jgi:predicted lipid-binding transport protein (Tim44 family)
MADRLRRRVDARVMRRTAALAAVLALALLWSADAWARAGSGGTSGSRGSRGFSSTPSTPSSPRPVTPPPPTSPQPAPSRWGGFGGMLGGLLVGGLLGGLLFGHGGGGIGLLEILIVGGLIWFAISFLRSRQEPAAPSGYPAPADVQSWTPSGADVSDTATATGPADLERGLGHIRQMDAAFDPARFADTASDAFFKIQAAWMARDMSGVAALLTDEMRGIFQRDCDALRAAGKINRLENIAVRAAEVTEAWQERGEDYVTVHFLASLLDFTTDESGARVLEGSRTEPVKFEESWTFVRPVGPNPFRLSAIQQA